MKVRQDQGRSGWRNSPRSGRWCEIRRVLLWSGVFNLLLTTVFMGTLIYGEARLAGKSAAPSGVAKAMDPVAQARLLRSDFERPANPRSRFAENRKGSLSFTQISAMAAITSGPSEDMPAKLSGEQEAPARLTRVPGASPVLRKSSKTGKLEIANFTTMNFEGSSDECPEFGVSMLEFADTSPDLLEILNSTDEITVARICAANGSVILSCRNEQITLSSRRARPGDGCSRQTLLPASIVSNGT